MADRFSSRTLAQGLMAKAIQAELAEAIALHRQGSLAEAERIYSAILRRDPEHFDALHLLGVIAVQTGRNEYGAELIGRALARDRRNAAAHGNLGNALANLGRAAEALASYDRAIKLKPDHADAHSNRGNVLLGLKRPQDALASYDRAIGLRPDYAEAHRNRGSALRDLKRPNEALASYDRAIALKPDYADAHHNRGIALRDLHRAGEALVSYDRALALRPDDAETCYNRAIALHELHRLDDAAASCERAIALKPDYAEAHFNLAHYLLLMGRFDKGWRQYEWRKRRDEPIAARSFPQPLWLGEPEIAGKTLFLWWEQGLGDTIQFCRYARLLEARGATVVMSVQEPLRRLLQQANPAIQMIAPDAAPAQFDHHCPLLSLPLALRSTLETIPAPTPYLEADRALQASWAARLPPKGKPRIGAVWSGGTAHRNDRDRSIELPQFLSVVHGNADWFSLQKELRDGDAAILARDGRIAFFGGELADFSDTAALLASMDLVITVDTAVAHLAGAMGKPVWVLLPHVPDWRWLLGRSDSPWYPSARLFRQQRIGDWTGVLEEVRRELRLVTG
jgi:tetratricopeptide (TPR) repeat protein